MDKKRNLSCGVASWFRVEVSAARRGGVRGGRRGGGCGEGDEAGIRACTAADGVKFCHESCLPGVMLSWLGYPSAVLYPCDFSSSLFCVCVSQRLSLTSLVR